MYNILINIVFITLYKNINRLYSVKYMNYWSNMIIIIFSDHINIL